MSRITLSRACEILKGPNLFLGRTYLKDVAEGLARLIVEDYQVGDSVYRMHLVVPSRLNMNVIDNHWIRIHCMYYAEYLGPTGSRGALSPAERPDLYPDAYTDDSETYRAKEEWIKWNIRAYDFAPDDRPSATERHRVALSWGVRAFINHDESDEDNDEEETWGYNTCIEDNRVAIFHADRRYEGRLIRLYMIFPSGTDISLLGDDVALVLGIYAENLGDRHWQDSADFESRFGDPIPDDLWWRLCITDFIPWGRSAAVGFIESPRYTDTTCATSVLDGCGGRLVEIYDNVTDAVEGLSPEFESRFREESKVGKTIELELSTLEDMAAGLAARIDAFRRRINEAAQSLDTVRETEGEPYVAGRESE